MKRSLLAVKLLANSRAAQENVSKTGVHEVSIVSKTGVHGGLLTFTYSISQASRNVRVQVAITATIIIIRHEKYY